MNIMEEKLKLERSFSEEYRELYCQLHESISDLEWHVRQQSIPNDQNRTKKNKRRKNNFFLSLLDRRTIHIQVGGGSTLFSGIKY